MTPTLPEEAVKAAQDAFNKTINDPIMVPCNRCSGKGYHYGFGEDGASPDWCVECGGSAFDVVPGEEERAMRAALTAALPFLPVQGAVKKLEWGNARITEDGREAEDAESPVGRYIATDTGWFLLGRTGYEVERGLYQAKAAAQADYEARIRSAIETVISVSEPSAARELALEEAAKNCEREAAEVEGLIDDVAYHLRKRAAAIRALSSPDHADANLFEILGKNPHLPKDGVKPDMEGIKSVVGRLSYRFPDHADTTDEMVEAALAVDWDNEDERATVHNIWHAMAAKLPTAPDADAGKVEGDGWSMSPPKFHRYPYFVENIGGKWCLCKHHGNGASHTISMHETAREARDAAPSEGAE